MNIINNTLNKKTQIKVDDRIIDVNDIEKWEMEIKKLKGETEKWEEL